MKPLELTGKRFGKLMVMKRADSIPRGFRSTPWVCRCDCGGERLVESKDLNRRGEAWSCGCSSGFKSSADGTDGRARRLARLADGLCSRCGQHPFAEGRKTCAVCIQRKADEEAGLPVEKKNDRHRYMSERDRFDACVVKKEGCWEWIAASRNRFGYGKIGVGGRTEAAHRVSYRLHKGEIPDGMVVMHTCDNPPCTNPEHLRLGTHADNNRDMDEKGRRVISRGTDSGVAVLDDIRVRQIWGSTGSAGEVARLFGVSPGAVKAIRQGRSWRHVTGGPSSYKTPNPKSNARLSEDDVRDIRRAQEQGESDSSIARRYGVTPTNIGFIRKRKSWKDVA